MRWILDIIALLTAIGLVVAVIAFQRAQGDDEAQIKQAAADLRRIELEIKYRAVTKGGAEVNEFGWPVTVSPAWFEGDPPRNTLLSPKRPWVEVAGPSEMKLMHPRIRVAVDETQAGFWYNPYQGVVRARVPVMMSDQDALDLYNRMNGSALRSVFEREKSPGSPAETKEAEAAEAEAAKPRAPAPSAKPPAPAPLATTPAPAPSDPAPSAIDTPPGAPRPIMMKAPSLQSGAPR